MWRGVYQLLLGLAYPLVRARLAWRGRREPAYRERVAERFGHVSPELPRGAVWFHTVSAGETIAAAPLIRTLAEEFTEVPFLVTTMTPTGSAQVQARLADCVAHCYAPYDFAGAVARFLDRTAPRLLVLMETELWPNLIAAAHRRGIPVVLINARLSPRSARGYGRIGALTKDMLGQLDFIACQYPDHASRFLELGAASDKVSALGSIKFDVRLPDDYVARLDGLRKQWGLGDRPVWIAASTHPGEEQVVLEAHRVLRNTYPDACLLLVPRHPARADEVEQLAGTAGFTLVRQSEIGHGLSADTSVVLCDTMGQLQYLYGLAQVAFIGGSLVPVGGHNPIEAAVCALPLLVGPETFNFAEVVTAFKEAGCLFEARHARGLAERIERLLADDLQRGRLGAAARQVVVQNTGATERLLDLLRGEIRTRERAYAAAAAVPVG